MPSQCSVFIATSLDGYIARPDGGLDWLLGAEQVAGEDYGYRDFYDSVDALVMGRHTYELVQGFAEWPYTGKPVWVLSSRYPAQPTPLREGAVGLAATPAEVVARLRAGGARHLYIDGGGTIQGFLRTGLIDELTLTRLPILLGEGRPLFGAVGRDIHLHHLATRVWDNGFVQSRYAVRRD